MAIPVNEKYCNTPWAIIVSFSLPGEIIRAKVYRNARMHSVADFVAVIQPNMNIRDNSRVQCRYFGKCGGCQYQVRLCVHTGINKTNVQGLDALIRNSALDQTRGHCQSLSKILR